MVAEDGVGEDGDSPEVNEETVRQEAASARLELIGVLSRREADIALSLHAERLRRWQCAGYAGEMRYMLRNAELFTALESFLPGCRSVIVFALPYYQGELPREVKNPPAGFGRVARYAWGKDYHTVLRERASELVVRLTKTVARNSARRFVVSARVFTDAVPLLERALGEAAELGFIGRNTLLIRRGLGSFFFVGEVLINVAIRREIPVLRVLNGMNSGCGSCRRCLDSCPTGAFVGERVLDSRRCISYLTIEKRGAFTDKERESLGNWVFGCDECQDVCPFNHRGIPASSVREFFASCGVGALLPLREVLTLRTVREYRGYFRGSAMLRARRPELLRNALAVLANQKAVEFLPGIIEVAREDRDEVVRNEARSALQRLVPCTSGIDRRRALELLRG